MEGMPPIRLGLRSTPGAICARHVGWRERNVQVRQLRRSRRCGRFGEQALPLRGTQGTADRRRHCSLSGDSVAVRSAHAAA